MKRSKLFLPPNVAFSGNIGRFPDRRFWCYRRPSSAMDRLDVALILWNADVIQWVSYVLLQQDFKCCGIEPSGGVDRIEELIATTGPRLVMLDLAPPYTKSTNDFLHLLERFPRQLFVITCADPLFAIQAAPWLCSQLMLQKPYGPETIRKIVVPLLSPVPFGFVAHALFDVEEVAGEILRPQACCFP
jgi:hypothetical protein